MVLRGDAFSWLGGCVRVVCAGQEHTLRLPQLHAAAPLFPLNQLHCFPLPPHRCPLPQQPATAWQSASLPLQCWQRTATCGAPCPVRCWCTLPQRRRTQWLCSAPWTSCSMDRWWSTPGVSLDSSRRRWVGAGWVHARCGVMHWLGGAAALRQACLRTLVPAAPVPRVSRAPAGQACRRSLRLLAARPCLAGPLGRLPGRHADHC